VTDGDGVVIDQDFLNQQADDSLPIGDFK